MKRHAVNEGKLWHQDGSTPNAKQCAQAAGSHPQQHQLEELV